MEEETRTIKIPDGYEFDRVEEGKVIFNKVDKGLPNTWKRCMKTFDYFESISTGRVCGFYVNPKEDVFYCDSDCLPDGLGKPMLALCQLLVCRNAWWKQLEYKPDWNDKRTLKYCIHEVGSGAVVSAVQVTTHSTFPRILAFPTHDIANMFLTAFRDLIEEAKELL